MTRITLAAFLLSGLTASAAMAQTSDYPRVQVQGVPGAASVGTTPGQLLVADPDISTVTVGTTAVNAFAATHVAKGGWIKNPTAAAAALCIRLTGVATTVESAGTTCIPAGQTYQIAAFAGTVSVNATDSAHVFSGQGYQ